ncbi:MAG: TatD family deoxyribonuclease, partial [Coriobacteriaceae bacterium]|nr:TatD family deoxyribonuclease [Coriobacteriaceae bacterium]
WRAVRAGCYFSVNARMLATRRGREYARILPGERLLLETDLPPESDPAFSLDAWEADLKTALRELEAVRGETLETVVRENSERCLL